MNLGILNQGPWYSFPTTFTSISRAQSHPDSITKLWCREQDSGGRDLPAQGPFTSIFQLWWVADNPYSTCLFSGKKKGKVLEWLV